MLAPFVTDTAYTSARIAWLVQPSMTAVVLLTGLPMTSMAVWYLLILLSATLRLAPPETCMQQSYSPPEMTLQFSTATCVPSPLASMRYCAWVVRPLSVREPAVTLKTGLGERLTIPPFHPPGLTVMLEFGSSITTVSPRKPGLSPPVAHEISFSKLTVAVAPLA